MAELPHGDFTLDTGVKQSLGAPMYWGRGKLASDGLVLCISEGKQEEMAGHFTEWCVRSLSLSLMCRSVSFVRSGENGMLAAVCSAPTAAAPLPST